MKRFIKCNDASIESAILDAFGSSDPGTGCSFIAGDGRFVNIYPHLDVHEDLCEWVTDNLGEQIKYPDEEWAIRSFGWIRLRKDPHMCIIELPKTRPTNSQLYSLEDWLSYVEDAFMSSGVPLYLCVCDDNSDGDVEFKFCKDYFTEDMMKVIKRYYAAGKMYASVELKKEGNMMKKVISKSNVVASRLPSALRNIDEEDFKSWTAAEKKIYAKACNSADPQIYLTGAVDALDLCGSPVSVGFMNMFNKVIQNWDYSRYNN